MERDLGGVTAGCGLGPLIGDRHPTCVGPNIALGGSNIARTFCKLPLFNLAFCGVDSTCTTPRPAVSIQYVYRKGMIGDRREMITVNNHDGVLESA